MASFTRLELDQILDGKILQDGFVRNFSNVAIDSRKIKKNGIFIAIKGCRLDGHRFVNQAIKNGARAVIISKKITVCVKDVLIIKVKDTTTALGDLAHAHRMKFSIPVIAVTGSAGKTTTKELIAQVLRTKYCVLKNKGSLNNQWGVPLTLLRLSAKHEIAVVEIGTNYPGEIKHLSIMVKPTIVVLTNIGKSHLRGLKTIQNVYQEKRSIIAGLMPGGTVVFNADDKFLVLLKRLTCNKLTYAIKHDADVKASFIQLTRSGKISFKINGRYQAVLQTPVKENVLNALAAIVCARLLKVSFNNICRALVTKKFQGNRQGVVKARGITMINDSYNANPMSFKSALRTLVDFPQQGEKVLVAGDMLELGDQAITLHRELAEYIVGLGIDRVFTVGPLMKGLVRKLKKRSPQIKALSYGNMDCLLNAIKKNINKGDIVLVKGSRGMRMEQVVEMLEAQ